MVIYAGPRPAGRSTELQLEAEARPTDAHSPRETDDGHIARRVPYAATLGLVAGLLKAKRDSMAPLAKGRLVAWNPVTKREAWRVEHTNLRSGGTLSTAGNLVFQGRGDGLFAAYRATDGTKLWQFDAQVASRRRR